MKFTEEMLAEDEKHWGNRDVLAELRYCSNYMRDRKDMTNFDIRFYAYIMRKAYYMLKEQEAKLVEIDGQLGGIKYGRCPKCGKGLNEEVNPHWCGFCGQEVKWDA